MDANKIESNTLFVSCQHTLNPTPIVPSNRYALLLDEDNEEATIIQSNTSTQHENQPPKPNQNAIIHTNYTTAQSKIAKNMAVADTGMTGHFVLPGTPVTNIKLARHPLKINLPDKDCLTPTHTCKMDIPWFPNEGPHRPWLSTRITNIHQNIVRRRM